MVITAEQWENGGWDGGGSPWFGSLLDLVNGRLGTANYPETGSRSDGISFGTNGGSSRRNAERAIAIMEYALPYFADPLGADEQGSFVGQAAFQAMSKEKFRERTAAIWDWERWDAGERGWQSLGDLFALVREYCQSCRWQMTRGFGTAWAGRLIEVDKQESGGTVKWRDYATSYQPTNPWAWTGITYYYWTSNLFKIVEGAQVFGYGAALCYGAVSVPRQDMTLINSRDYRFDATVDLYSGGFGDGSLRHLSSTPMRIGHLAGRWVSDGGWPFVGWTYEVGRTVGGVWVPGTEDFAGYRTLWTGNTSAMENVWAVVKIETGDECPWQV
jgi:hypothetical protein